MSSPPSSSSNVPVEPVAVAASASAASAVVSDSPAATSDHRAREQPSRMELIKKACVEYRKIPGNESKHLHTDVDVFHYASIMVDVGLKYQIMFGVVDDAQKAEINSEIDRQIQEYNASVMSRYDMPTEEAEALEAKHEARRVELNLEYLIDSLQDGDKITRFELEKIASEARNKAYLEHTQRLAEAERRLQQEHEPKTEQHRLVRQKHEKQGRKLRVEWDRAMTEAGIEDSSKWHALRREARSEMFRYMLQCMSEQLWYIARDAYEYGPAVTLDGNRRTYRCDDEGNAIRCGPPNTRCFLYLPIAMEQLMTTVNKWDWPAHIEATSIHVLTQPDLTPTALEYNKIQIKELVQATMAYDPDTEFVLHLNVACTAEKDPATEGQQDSAERHLTSVHNIYRIKRDAWREVPALQYMDPTKMDRTAYCTECMAFPMRRDFPVNAEHAPRCLLCENDKGHRERADQLYKEAPTTAVHNVNFCTMQCKVDHFLRVHKEKDFPVDVSNFLTAEEKAIKAKVKGAYDKLARAREDDERVLAEVEDEKERKSLLEARLEIQQAWITEAKNHWKTTSRGRARLKEKNMRRSMRRFELNEALASLSLSDE